MTAKRVVATWKQMRLRFPTALAATLALSGCSYGYELIGERVGQSIQFRVADGSEPLFRSISCAKSVRVYSDDPAEPQLWTWESPEMDDCLADFPLTYGATPQGAVHVEPAKVLRPGKTYRIHVLSPGSGSGVGEFRIMPSGALENLRP